MYSPKIREKALIHRLYKLKQEKGKPMTILLSEALEQYLEKEEKSAQLRKKNERAQCI